MSRRRRAVVEFVSLTAVLAVLESLRRRMDEDDPNRPGWASPWALAGVLAGLAYGWGNDRDWCGVRTNRRRKVLFSASQTVGRQLLFDDGETRSREFSLGQLAGFALDRLRYGVLGALPGDD